MNKKKPENLNVTRMRIEAAVSHLGEILTELGQTVKTVNAGVIRIKASLNTPYTNVIDGMNTPLPFSIKCICSTWNTDLILESLKLNGISDADVVRSLFSGGPAIARPFFKDDGMYLEISLSSFFLGSRTHPFPTFQAGKQAEDSEPHSSTSLQGSRTNITLLELTRCCNQETSNPENQPDHPAVSSWNRQF